MMARRENGVRASESELLTPGEVAALFGVDGKTIARWATNGRLNGIRTLGGHRRFRADEIYAILDAHTESPPAGGKEDLAAPAPSELPADELIAGLQVWSAGQWLPIQAAVKLLIADGYWLRRPDFVAGYLRLSPDQEQVSLLWRAAGTAIASGDLHPTPAVKLAVLDLVVALAEDRFWLSALSGEQARAVAVSVLQVLAPHSVIAQEWAVRLDRDELR